MLKKTPSAAIGRKLPESRNTTRGPKKPYSVGGDLMTATVKDPFGNVIGLIYNPHFQLKD